VATKPILWGMDKLGGWRCTDLGLKGGFLLAARLATERKGKPLRTTVTCSKTIEKKRRESLRTKKKTDRNRRPGMAGLFGWSSGCGEGDIRGRSESPQDSDPSKH